MLKMLIMLGKSKGLIFNLLFDLDKLYIYIIVPLFVTLHTLHYISYSHNGKYYYIVFFSIHKRREFLFFLFLKFEK